MVMITIKDIAQEAGVSITTVSNVIHGAKSRVSQETVEKITKIIERHHYTPNMSARALINKNSRIVGVVNHAVHSGAKLSEDPFLSLLLRAIEQELSQHDYYMMFRTVSTERELLALCSTWNLTGMIIIGVFEGAFFRRLAKSGVPCVLLDSYIPENTLYNVGLEDFKGGYMATKYLIDKGHRQIAFVSPPVYDQGVVHERFMGYRKALEEAGIAFDEKNAYEVTSVDEGKPVGRALAARNDISAVFATADLLAAGIIAGLYEEGRRVPDDMSVIGFDDMYLSNTITPPLTTIRQDVRQKGVLAVSILLEYLENKKIEKNTVLPVELVERASVRSLL